MKIDAQKLASKIEDEFEKHENNKTTEKERHRNRLDTLKGKAGLDDMIDRAEEVQELAAKKSDLNDEIETSFFRALQALCPRKRQSADSITIRDNRAWYYGRSSKIGLTRFLAKDKYVRQARQLVEEDSQSTYDEIMEAIQNLETENASSYRVDWKTPRFTKDISDCENLEHDWFGMSGNDVKAARTDNDKNQLFDWKCTKTRVTSDKPSELKRLVALKPHVLEAHDELENELQRQVEKREEVLKTIKTAASKQLVASNI